MLTRILLVTTAAGLLAACSALAGPSPSPPRETDVSHTPSAATATFTTPPETATPTTPVSSQHAVSRCLLLDVPTVLPMPDGTTLAAAFATVPERIAGWRAKLGQAIGIEIEPLLSEAPSVAPRSSVSDMFVCYFDGDFGRPRGDPSGIDPNYNRIIVLIDADGWPSIAGMGYVDRLPIIDPNLEE